MIGARLFFIGVYTLCTSYEYLYKDGCVVSDSKISSEATLEYLYQDTLRHPR